MRKNNNIKSMKQLIDLAIQNNGIVDLKIKSKLDEDEIYSHLCEFFKKIDGSKHFPDLFDSIYRLNRKKENTMKNVFSYLKNKSIHINIFKLIGLKEFNEEKLNDFKLKLK